MAQPEFMKVYFKHILEDIRLQYKLHNKLSSQDYIYIRINKGMYGLKQAAILAYDNLKHSLTPHGYAPIIDTVGIWGHITRPSIFCLRVDNFRIKYFNIHDAQHLLDAISHTYKYTTDWGGGNCGLALDWHYLDGYLNISMPEYLKTYF